MLLNDFLYICLSWPAALAHGKIEENSVNSCVFKGLGRSRHWTFFDARALKTLFWTDFMPKTAQITVFSTEHIVKTLKIKCVCLISCIYVWVCQKSLRCGRPPHAKRGEYTKTRGGEKMRKGMEKSNGEANRPEIQLFFDKCWFHFGLCTGFPTTRSAGDMSLSGPPFELPNGP